MGGFRFVAGKATGKATRPYAQLENETGEVSASAQGAAESEAMATTLEAGHTFPLDVPAIVV